MAAKPGTVRTDTDRLGLEAGRSIAEVPAPDVVLVPGGEGNRPLLRRAGAGVAAIGTRGHSVHELGMHRRARRAGILDGLRATTHWAYLDTLRGSAPLPSASGWSRTAR